MIVITSMIRNDGCIYIYIYINVCGCGWICKTFQDDDMFRVLCWLTKSFQAPSYKVTIFRSYRALHCTFVLPGRALATLSQLLLPYILIASPAINVVALTIAWLLGGVVVIEVVFNYPGLGRLMIDSISDRDLPVVQSIALIVASVYVCVNLAADLLTMLANPQLRTMHTRK